MSQQTARSNRFAPSAVCGALALAVACIYGQTLRHEFVNFDDPKYIVHNAHIHDGLTAECVRWAFTAREACNWHPLAWLSHAVDCRIFGPAPWGHHLTNVLLHAANAVLLFLVLLRMTGDFWPSAFAAALFAVHPLRVESVAWAAERKDVLSGLFFMLTLWAYSHYTRRTFSWSTAAQWSTAAPGCVTAEGSRAPLFWHLLVVLFFSLGLLSKPMVVTLPLVLFLLDYWPLERPGGRFFLFLEKFPLLALSVASCAATLWAQGEAIAAGDRIPPAARIGNAAVSYIAYLGQWFWPADLAVLYPFPESGPPAWKVAGAMLILIGVSAAPVVSRRRFPWFLVGWLWYLIMLLPVIGLVQVGTQAMADRYTYLPQIGLGVALAWSAARLARFRIRFPLECSDSSPLSVEGPNSPLRRCMNEKAAMNRRTPKKGFWAVGVASVFAIAALAATAWHQTSFWRNSETLWTRALDCTANNAVAHYNLAVFLNDRQRPDEAAEQYRMAIAVKPDYAEAHYNLGVILAKQGRIEEAMRHYKQAVQSAPDASDAHYNLAVLLTRCGRIDEAVAHYEAAIAAAPDFAEAHNNLGALLDQQGKLSEAIGHFRRALEIDPNYADARRNLAIALGRSR